MSSNRRQTTRRCMKFREMARIRRLQAPRKYQAISEPAPLFDYKAIHAEALTLRALLPLGICPRQTHGEVVRCADPILAIGFHAKSDMDRDLNSLSDQGGTPFAPTGRFLFHVKQEERQTLTAGPLGQRPT